MSASRITKAGLKSLLRTLGRGQVAYLWDRGLGAKCSVDAEGVDRVTFVFKGRPKGSKARWLSLGDDLDQAEKQAAIWRGVIAAGGDPFAAIEAQAAKRRAAVTVAVKAAEWMVWNATKEKPISPSTAQDYQTILDRHVFPAIGDRAVAEVSGADIQRLRSKLTGKPTQGNRVRAVLSSLFEWARVRPSPVDHFDKFAEHQRERHLSDGELARLGEALRTMETEQAAPIHTIAAVRAMLLSGARPGELVSLRWEQVDLEHGVIHLGPTKTGKKDPRAKRGLPITPPLSLLLRELPRIEGNPYVFVGKRRSSHVWSYGDTWKEAVRRAGIDCSDPDVLKPYTSRHTAGTHAGMEHSQAVVANVLGHRRVTTAAKYQHDDQDATTRAASEVAGRIAAALDREAK